MLISLLMISVCLLAGLFMPKKLFARPAVPLLIGLCAVAVFTLGCTATWLSAVSAMLPSIVTLVESVVAFAVGLSSKTISPTVVAFIQQTAADIQVEITEVQSLITTYQSSASATTLGKISATMGAIVTGLGTILSGANITDASTVGKITQLVGLAVAACQAVIGLIPLVAGTMANYEAKSITAGVAEHADAQAATLIKSHHKVLQDGYKIWRTTPALPASVTVDAVVGTLPNTI